MNNDWNYIDIHAHILPGVDDGPQSVDEAVEMAKEAYAEGIRAIIATPHYGIINPGFDRGKADGIFEELRSKIKEACPDMLLVQGNELFYGSGILEGLHSGTALTMGGSDYVLVEFNVDADYSIIKNGLRELISAGYRPILAHAERYSCLSEGIDHVQELTEQGAYIQINGRSFLRKRLDKKRLWCRKLVRNGLVHFVATDCHNTGSRRPVMQEVAERLLDITDQDTAYDLVFRNGIKLLKNQFI